MNFFSGSVSLMTYLSYIFLLDASILTTFHDEKKGNFWRILLKFEEKILEIHKHSWLSMFYPHSRFVTLRILSYQESTVAAPIQ